jgi:hypothetical protein
MQDNGRNPLKTMAFQVNRGKRLLSEAGPAGRSDAYGADGCAPCGIICQNPAGTGKQGNPFLHVKARQTHLMTEG